jgi:hypothetical protein
MTRQRAPSTHARALLAALLAAGDRWSYGYGLASLTGIKSGTLTSQRSGRRRPGAVARRDTPIA